jgi:type IV secretion system protein VirD4
MFWKVFFPVTLAAFAFGFPVAELTVHGLNLSLWPANAQPPSAWFSVMANSYGLGSLLIYRDMAFGHTNSLGPAGRLAAAWILVGPVLALIGCCVPKYGLRRDPNGTHGDARWATRRERRKMRIGLELGLDPDTGRPIRVSTESHFITVAPPRTGKTSGLVIPNLAAPEKTAWFGPALVIDPKGEIFHAVAARRRELGRTVRCLDPIGIVGGIDTWNPLASLNPDNILHLQRIARALLPDHVTGEAVYFQNRAVAVIVGAFLAAHSVKRATPVYAASLLSDVKEFEKLLEPLKGAAASEAMAVLKMDAKGRDSILSTAAQAFSWCADPRLQRLTEKSSFSLSALSDGNTDLFITLPVEDMTTLTPLMRWLLCELFTVVRRQRPREPIVCFIDETAALGRFDELVAVAGELPGHNIRLWTFWQDRSQIVGIYGEAGAKTLLNTAEIATYSDLPLIDPDERDFVSRAIGDYTIFQSVKTRDEKTGKTSVTDQPVGIHLMASDAVGQIASTDLIVFPNCKHYAKRPMIIRKTRYDDSRLVKFVTAKN